MNLKDWRFLCLLWLLVGTALVLLLVAMEGPNGLPFRYDLMRDGVAVQAKVIRVERNNHCRAEYRFRAEGWDYSGAGPACQAEAGQLREVTYLRDNPTRSALGDARDGFINEVMFHLFVALGIPPFMFFMWRVQARKK